AAPAPGLSPRAASSGASASSRALPPLELPARRRRSRFGRGVAVALLALAAVAAAVVLFAVTGVGGPSSGSSASNSTNASSASAGAFKTSSVTVAVLNGTAVNQLAHRIADRLSALGYKQGTVATASNQTESTTKVAYLSGRRNRIDALHVATALGL